MQEYIDFGWGTGFAVIMGFILIVVFFYSVVKIKKQASEAQERQRKKEAASRELPKEQE